MEEARPEAVEEVLPGVAVEALPEAVEEVLPAVEEVLPAVEEVLPGAVEEAEGQSGVVEATAIQRVPHYCSNVRSPVEPRLLPHFPVQHDSRCPTWCIAWVLQRPAH